MNREQAKEILQTCPPGGDDSDARLREAFEAAASNPELMAWFKEQQALDRSIQQKLRSAPPPRELLSEIVTGWNQRPVHRRAKRLAGPNLLALAAALVMFVGVAAVIWNWLAPRQTEMGLFRANMAGFLKEFPPLEVYVERQSEVSQWLAQKPGFSKAEMPERLKKYPAIGCREIEWRGKRVALVCLMADGEIVHLFVMPGAKIRAPGTSEPQFARAGRFNTAEWVQDEFTYMVMTPATRQFLQKLL